MKYLKNRKAESAGLAFLIALLVFVLARPPMVGAAEDTPVFANAAQTLANKTLAAVSITTSLAPGTAGGATIGTAALPFSSAYIGDAATNNFQITGTATAARVMTLSDVASDTFALLAATQTFTNKTFTDPVMGVHSPLEGATSSTPRWIFKQVDHTDMTAAATNDTFALWTLPANTMIHDVIGNVTAAWAGTGPVTAAVCSVGTNAGSANDLTVDDDFFAVAVVYELHDATASGGKGALLFDSTDKFAPYFLVAGGQIDVDCDLTGGNHADTSAGSAGIYMLVSQPFANATEAN
jgi:hypothetical protein